MREHRNKKEKKAKGRKGKDIETQLPIWIGSSFSLHQALGKTSVEMFKQVHGCTASMLTSVDIPALY